MEMDVNETYHSYSIPGPHDTEDSKVDGSKVKVKISQQLP